MKQLLCLLFLVSSSALQAQTVLVQPYVQPGNGSSLENTDVKTVIWLTDQTPADFTVEFNVKGKSVRSAKVDSVALDFEVSRRPPEKEPAILEREQHYYKYWSTLTDLPFDSEVEYRVKMSGTLVRGGVFHTRASAENAIRFVAVGDLAKATAAQNTVAYQISRVRPQFLMALGDIVYPNGRVLQYFNHYWRTYNHPVEAGPDTGAPLMASVPFYAVAGNHDLDAKLPVTPDALGIFYFFHVPLNGPGEGPWNHPLPKDLAAKFRADAGPNYPAVSYYSFDYGPAHFLVLDSGNFDLAKLGEWVEKDLKATRARWKFVCIHAPAFHSSLEHQDAQKMRLLVPLLERCGVDLVLAGHIHNYQRTRPMHFEPATDRSSKDRYVDGTFKLDMKFDGIENTRPDGIIHIVSGGGGANLYKGSLEKNSEALRKLRPNNWVPYTAKFDCERHSFTVIDLTPERLELRALDGTSGEEFDKIIITKPAP